MDEDVYLFDNKNPFCERRQMITLMNEKMKLIVGVTICLLLAACGEPTTGDDEAGAVAEISAMEDSVRQISKRPDFKVSDLRMAQNDLVKTLLSFYKEYPESNKSADYLDRASAIFADMDNYYKSVQWADTLLRQFPDYKDRALVLEGQAVAYDVMIQPRDSAKVRLYYSMLLNEFPSLEKEKREGVMRRLRYNHMGFDAYILQMQMDLTNSKSD